MEEEELQQEEKVNIRHTITAEETFTLAKDVYDLRTLIKNIYANRAVISRRLNILSLSFSAVITLLYAAYVLFTALTKKLSLEFTLTLYILLGIYAALFVVLIIFWATSSKGGTKNIRRTKKVLKVFKLLVRMMSIAVSVVAIVYTSQGPLAAQNVAVDILIVVFSIIMLIVQIIPLLFGGLGKLARWLISPVKKKCRFSYVLLEWYDLAVSGTVVKGSRRKISSKYFEDIGTIIDNYIIPALGKKYISTIKSAQIYSVVARVDEAERPIIEGVFKNVFSYATECGYVTLDPCKDLNFEGSVEEEERTPPKKTFKDRLAGLGKKIGKKALDKIINDNITEE